MFLLLFFRFGSQNWNCAEKFFLAIQNLLIDTLQCYISITLVLLLGVLSSNLTLRTPRHICQKLWHEALPQCCWCHSGRPCACNQSSSFWYTALFASGCNHRKSTNMEKECSSLNVQPNWINLSSFFGNT